MCMGEFYSHLTFGSHYQLAATKWTISIDPVSVFDCNSFQFHALCTLHSGNPHHNPPDPCGPPNVQNPMASEQRKHNLLPLERIDFEFHLASHPRTRTRTKPIPLYILMFSSQLLTMLKCGSFINRAA